MIMDFQSIHQQHIDVVRLVHGYDTYVSDTTKQTSSELPQVSKKTTQGEPNQLYLKLRLGECDEHIPHGKLIILAGGFSI